MAVLISEIRAIYQTERLDSEVQAFLDDALLIVNEDIRPKCTMSEERYDLITKYLTAHFLSVSDSLAQDGSVSGGALKRSKLGEADESYAVPNAEMFGFNATRWGQMAVAIDKCGILSGLSSNAGLKAQFRIV